MPLPDAVPPWALQSGRADKAADVAELYTESLDLAWQSYLSSGGFPRAVAEHARNGAVSEAFVADLLAWLNRDVSPDPTGESVALLLAELTARSNSPLNRSALANVLNYRSRQTFELRLDRLTASFAALWCHQIDESGNRVTGAQSKLCLADPLLAWLAPRSRSGLATPNFTALTEAALAVGFARAIDDLQDGRWNSGDTVGYLRTGHGNEVDFASVAVPSASGTERTTPIESKWVSHGWRAEARVLENKFNRGVVATRSVIDKSHAVWALPAPLVSLLLG